MEAEMSKQEWIERFYYAFMAEANDLAYSHARDAYKEYSDKEPEDVVEYFI
jgi:hypothetical protein